MQDFRSCRSGGSLSVHLLPWEEWPLVYQVVPAEDIVWEDTMNRVKNISRGRLVGPTGDGSRGIVRVPWGLATQLRRRLKYWV